MLYLCSKVREHSSRKRFFSFFLEIQKKRDFYVFLTDLSKKTKKRNYINTA